jgi:signal transduction histidine kinase/CheY-like chemotaxis protein
VIVTEEALNAESLRLLAATLGTQPSWSDLPFIVFTAAHQSPVGYRRSVEALEQLGNVTEIERPVHPLTLRSAVRAALRARRRQYETRELVRDLELALHQRDAFLAILGHELRNPLGAIGNAVELALRSPDGAAPEKELVLIQRQVKILSRLVNDLLDVSRVTSGKVSLVKEPVDLVALLERLVLLSRERARNEQIELSLSADRGPITLMGDAVRLEQVFNNLLNNALKYTPARGRIAVQARRRDGQAVVTVRDSGVGIPSAALPLIFDLFAQADTSLDRAQGGMGIGLTLVRSLVELHGGSVQAASAGPGQGSEFTVSLPIATTVPDRAETPVPARESTPPERRVLVVEDNTDNRLSLQALLEDLGHHVQGASTGTEGIELALANTPDIALIDIGLPELDGYQVARRIRTALGRRIRLVALTGYGQPEDVRRALDAGFDAHLVKPIDFATLERLLDGADGDHRS